MGLVVSGEKEYMGEGDELWPEERLAESPQYGDASSSTSHACFFSPLIISQKRSFIKGKVSVAFLLS